MPKTIATYVLYVRFVGAPTLAFADDACSAQAMEKNLAGAD